MSGVYHLYRGQRINALKLFRISYKSVGHILAIGIPFWRQDSIDLLCKQKLLQKLPH